MPPPHVRNLDVENWAILCTFLPKGWEEMARRTGALRRARGVPDAPSLLRLLLLHVANGYSLAETSVRGRQLGIDLTSVAVFKRLQASEEWLRWLAEQERGTERLVLESQGRAVRVVDGTSVSEPGSTGTDWKIHYSINLANLQCDFFQLTAVENGGETLRRVPVQAADIMMGDRVYATPGGVAHVTDAGGDVVVRLNRQSLPVFDGDGNRLNVLRLFREIRVGQPQQWMAPVRHPGGGWVQGRLIAVRRSAQAVRLARRRLERQASRQQTKVSRQSWKAAEYFAVWTSLPQTFSPSAVLELYRLRWQIEVAFKRM
jgi:hypothetical protein